MENHSFDLNKNIWKLFLISYRRIDTKCDTRGDTAGTPLEQPPTASKGIVFISKGGELQNGPAAVQMYTEFCRHACRFAR